ncbi:MAG: hypothetical protein L6Q78_13240 [Bacteroidia bacterium]|nr:hypothetical protein [Bacteroidia bacterium]
MFSKKGIRSFITNFRGWRTDRKIVVFESDDWGTIRSVGSKDVIEIYKKFGIQLNEYNLFDCLEQNEDLIELFDLLSGFKSNVDGKPSKFTANCIVKNPDFSSIEKNSFKNYYSEDVRATFQNSEKSDQVFQLWKQGLQANLFIPQLHGREHINSRIWLEHLNMDSVDRQLFNYRMWGAVAKSQDDFYYRNSMAGLNYRTESEQFEVVSAIKESVELFFQLFGFYSDSYIANNYIWDPTLEKILFENNVKFIQGQPNQLFTTYWREKTGRKTERHYQGQRNSLGQMYLIRNCFFEPVTDQLNSTNSINQCLFEINEAFKYKKPAIISTHRVNYMGGISMDNRINGLKKLSSLLKKIIEQHPDVEFLSSSELGNLIARN